MNSILISLPEVAGLADNMQQINQQMAESLQRAKQEMNALASYWESAGAEEIRLRFERFSSGFDEKYQIIEEYVQFLRHTVESYDSLETTIHANANNF